MGDLVNPFKEGTLYYYLYEVYTQEVAPSDVEIAADVLRDLDRSVSISALYNFKSKLRAGSFPGMSGGVRVAAQRRSR